MATSPSIATPQPPSISETISPDSIDTLPVLSSLLARLQNPSNIPTGSTAGSPPAASPSQLASGSGPLTIKEIPLAADELKHKIQKARMQAKNLPDVDRTKAEQEDEIRELEERIRKQREVLERMRDVGVAARGDRERRESQGGADLMES